jgi:hypothetical protein
VGLLVGLLVAPLAGETSSQHCPGPTLAWSPVLSLVGLLVLLLAGRLVKGLEVTPACAPAYAPAGAPACTCVKARTRPTFSGGASSSPTSGTSSSSSSVVARAVLAVV